MRGQKAEEGRPTFVRWKKNTHHARARIRVRLIDGKTGSARTAQQTWRVVGPRPFPALHFLRLRRALVPAAAAAAAAAGLVELAEQGGQRSEGGGAGSWNTLDQTENLRFRLCLCRDVGRGLAQQSDQREAVHRASQLPVVRA